jgi:SAM-dependent methyltransferase
LFVAAAKQASLGTERDIMTPEHLERLRQIHIELANEEDPARRVGWPARWMQIVAFELLAGVASLQGQTVLDVGCGLGDLHAFLRARGWQGDYIGIDTSPELLAEAKQRHPSVRFEVVDALTDEVPVCDYALASGVFDYPIGGSEYAPRILARLFTAARRGVAWNRLLQLDGTARRHAESASEGLLHCYMLSPDVVCRTDVNLNLATFYVYRRAHFVTTQSERLVGQLALEPALREAMRTDPETVLHQSGVSAQAMSFFARMFWDVDD